MRDYPSLLYKAAIGCVVLAFLTTLFVALAPAVLGKNGLILGLGPIAAMLFIVLGALITVAASILMLYEIATAKNDSTWKAIWIIAILVLGLVGAASYMAIARKERKA